MGKYLKVNLNSPWESEIVDTGRDATMARYLVTDSNAQVVAQHPTEELAEQHACKWSSLQSGEKQVRIMYHDSSLPRHCVVIAIYMDGERVN